MKRLADSGYDYLKHALSCCRETQVIPGVSIRMNDMHDAPWPGSNLYSNFYMNHHELHLANPSACGWGAKGLNYRHKVVRNYYLSLIKEIAENYDFEILELDFLRFQSYFPRNEYSLNTAIMTSFISDIRKLLNKTKRKIELIPRISLSPSSAFELGFDVKKWCKNGLVDGITIGAFLQVPWNAHIDEYRELTGNTIPIYVSTDLVAAKPEGLTERLFPLEEELMRGFAAGVHAAGANGISLFNFFSSRKYKKEPLFKSVPCMRPPFIALPKKYLLNTHTSNGETDGPIQLPQFLPPRQPKSFWLWMGGEKNVAAKTKIIFSGKIPKETLRLNFNYFPAGHPSKVAIIKKKPTCLHMAEFEVPASTIKNGKNKIILRSETNSITVLSIEVIIPPIEKQA